MDITQAQDLLNRKIAQNTQDSEAYAFALSVLNTTYAPEFTELENLRVQVQQLSDANTALTAERDNLSAQVDTLNTQIATTQPIDIKP